jgi:hypothetical protein
MTEAKFLEFKPIGNFLYSTCASGRETVDDSSHIGAYRVKVDYAPCG